MIELLLRDVICFALSIYGRVGPLDITKKETSCFVSWWCRSHPLTSIRRFPCSTQVSICTKITVSSQQSTRVENGWLNSASRTSLQESWRISLLSPLLIALWSSVPQGGSCLPAEDVAQSKAGEVSETSSPAMIPYQPRARTSARKGVWHAPSTAIHDTIKCAGVTRRRIVCKTPHKEQVQAPCATGANYPLAFFLLKGVRLPPHYFVVVVDFSIFIKGWKVLYRSLTVFPPGVFRFHLQFVYEKNRFSDSRMRNTLPSTCRK